MQKRFVMLAALLVVLTSGGVVYAVSGTDQTAKVKGTSQQPVLVDGNNRVLGPLVGSAQCHSFYSSSLNLLVAVDGSGNIVSPMDGYSATNLSSGYFAEYYQTSDCTGTPYLLQNNISGVSRYDYLLRSVNGKYYQVDPSSKFTNLSMHTTLDAGNSCDVTTASDSFVPLESVRNIPYSDPLAGPVHLASR